MLGQPSCQTLPPSTVADSLRRQSLRESSERERTKVLLEPANRPAPAHRLASGAHRGQHQPAASIPSASSRRALFRDRWAISWPTAMTIAIGHSTTSNSAITVRPTYQARCSGLRESATGMRERCLALRRFTPRPRTRPFMRDAGRAVWFVDPLRLVVATAPPEGDFSSAARYPPSALLGRAEGAASVDWINRARSASTFVFNTVPPSPRIPCRITSMSPSLSSTKIAELPGFISA
jgi:hypothetical protein